MLEHDEKQGENGGETLLTAGQLAAKLGVCRQTLDRWRRRGIGPTPLCLSGPDGRCLRYDLANVNDWLARCAREEGQRREVAQQAKELD